MTIVWTIAAVGFPTVGTVMYVALRQSFPQWMGAGQAPEGGRQASVDFGGRRRRAEGEYEVETFNADLVMFDVDRKSGRVRVAAARRAKEER